MRNVSPIWADQNATAAFRFLLEKRLGHDTIDGIALTLIWLQCPFYWAHEFEEYVLPGGFLDFFNRNMMGSTRGDKPLTKVGSKKEGYHRNVQNKRNGMRNY